MQAADQLEEDREWRAYEAQVHQAQLEALRAQCVPRAPTSPPTTSRREVRPVAAAAAVSPATEVFLSGAGAGGALGGISLRGATCRVCLAASPPTASMRVGRREESVRRLSD